MKYNKFSFLVLSAIMIISGCANSETEIKTKVYETFFKKIMKAGIPKIMPENIVIIEGNEIQIFKDDMKNIDNIEEYTSDSAIGTNFKNDFRLLYIHTEQTLKENKFLALLYSSKEKAMIVRKYDLFPDFKEDAPNLTVYEFKISERVASLLEKYENTLPSEGYFYNSWPEIHYK